MPAKWGILAAEHEQTQRNLKIQLASRIQALPGKIHFNPGQALKSEKNSNAEIQQTYSTLVALYPEKFSNVESTGVVPG